MVQNSGVRRGGKALGDLVVVRVAKRQCELQRERK
jgi:hypothetical protein